MNVFFGYLTTYENTDLLRSNLKKTSLAVALIIGPMAGLGHGLLNPLPPATKIAGGLLLAGCSFQLLASSCQAYGLQPFQCKYNQPGSRYN